MIHGVSRPRKNHKTRFNPRLSEKSWKNIKVDKQFNRHICLHHSSYSELTAYQQYKLNEEIRELEMEYELWN